MEHSCGRSCFVAWWLSLWLSGGVSRHTALVETHRRPLGHQQRNPLLLLLRCNWQLCSRSIATSSTAGYGTCFWSSPSWLQMQLVAYWPSCHMIAHFGVLYWLSWPSAHTRMTVWDFSCQRQQRQTALVTPQAMPVYTTGCAALGALLWLCWYVFALCLHACEWVFDLSQACGRSVQYWCSSLDMLACLGGLAPTSNACCTSCVRIAALWTAGVSAEPAQPVHAKGWRVKCAALLQC